MLHSRRPEGGGPPRRGNELCVHGGDRLVSLRVQGGWRRQPGDYGLERPGSLQDRQQLPGGGRGECVFRRRGSVDPEARALRHRGSRKLPYQEAVVETRGSFVRWYSMYGEEPPRVKERRTSAGGRERLRT